MDTEEVVVVSAVVTAVFTVLVFVVACVQDLFACADMYDPGPEGSEVVGELGMKEEGSGGGEGSENP